MLPKGRDDLSATAREALEIAEHSAAFSTGGGLNVGELIRAMLGAAGVEHPDDVDVFVCSWPSEVALEIARTFFSRGAPLTKLCLETINGEWAALRAFDAVRASLFVLLDRYVTPERYDHAVRFAAKLGEEAFERLYELARQELADLEAGDDEEQSVPSYLTALYLRNLLSDHGLTRYFSDAAFAQATASVSETLDHGIARLGEAPRAS